MSLEITCSASIVDCSHSCNPFDGVSDFTTSDEDTMHLVKEVGSDGIFVKTDVANEDDVRLLVEKTVKIYGRLDYAFNNAGIEETPTSLVEETSNVFDQIMNVNVKGVWL